MNLIKVPYGTVNKLAMIHKVARKTVRKALNGETTTDLAKKIRKSAIEHGGKEYTSIN